MIKEIVKEKRYTLNRHSDIINWISAVCGELILLICVYGAYGVIHLLHTEMDAREMFSWFEEPVTEIAVYGLTLVVLLITGLLPDFLRSFVYGLMKKESITTTRLKRSLFSVKLAMISAVIFDLFSLIFNFVSITSSLFEMPEWTVLLPIYGGTAIHGILPTILLLPIYARLKIRLISE